MTFEQLDQPAWDGVLDGICRKWDDRLALLRAADEELREAARRGKRLTTIDRDVQHWSQIRDETRRELVDLERRKALAVDRAVEDAGQRAVLGRAKRMEAAREWAEELQEEQLKGTRRIISSRMTGAVRELDQLQDELRDIGTHPMYRNEQTLAWLSAVHEAVQGTLRRDERARELVVRPWLQRRAADESLLRTLQNVVGDHMVPAPAFSEGAVHVIGGDQLAVIEVRDGNNDVRVQGVNGHKRLVQDTAMGQRAVGINDGSLTGLEAITNEVSAAAGAPAQAIICFLGWRAAPAKVNDIILCGPNLLIKVLQALPRQTASGAVLANVAQALGSRPLPEIAVPSPAQLDQFANLSPDDVPAVLPQLTRLLNEAHSRVIDVREAVGARG